MICPDCALLVPDSAPDCPICGYPFVVAVCAGAEAPSNPVKTTSDHGGRSTIRIRRGTVERFRRDHPLSDDIHALMPPPLKSAITKANPLFKKAEAFLNRTAMAALRVIRFVFRIIGRGITACWDAIDAMLKSFIELDMVVGSFLPNGWDKFDRDVKADFSSHGWRIVRWGGAVAWRIIRTMLLLGILLVKIVVLLVVLVIALIIGIIALAA